MGPVSVIFLNVDLSFTTVQDDLVSSHRHATGFLPPLSPPPNCHAQSRGDAGCEEQEGVAHRTINMRSSHAIKIRVGDWRA